MSAVENGKLYMVTPTIRSFPISKITGFDVYLKLENVQIPGSFKIRGIGNLVQKAVSKGFKRIVCASGGNAGMAAAYAAMSMGLPATIVLPESTPSFVADKLRDEYGADVQIFGNIWDESNKYAIEMANIDSDCLYVHPFDHPDIWDGHMTMIEEAAQQLPCQPDIVIASVGGGGLLNGVLMGMKKVSWDDVTFLAMETMGADCLNASLKAGKRTSLSDITSVAKCLGSLTPSAKTLELLHQHKKFHSVVVHDKEAVSACLRFADDHRFLTEPACGATLAAVYGSVIKDLISQGNIAPVKSALVIVCGGSSVSLAELNNLKIMFGLE